MKEIIKLGLILAFVCFISALTLAFVNDLTKERIAEQRFAATLKARQEAFPQSSKIEEMEEAILSEIKNQFPSIKMVTIVYDEADEKIGYIVESTPNGYGGPIEVITGIHIEEYLTGVRVGNHTETVGLGAKIREPFFYGQYEGKSTTSSLSSSDIDAIAGATISGDAVTQGVNDSIRVVNWLLDQNFSSLDEMLEQRERERLSAYQAIFSEADHFIALDEHILESVISAYPDVLSVYVASSETNLCMGYVIESSAEGYRGPVQVITGIHFDGFLTGSQVSVHQETAGLGTKIEEPDFYEQFNNLSLKSGDLADIDGISGATVSVSAFKEAVDIAIKAQEWLNGHMASVGGALPCELNN